MSTPADDPEPSPGAVVEAASAAVAAPQGFARFVARGAARRCPRCGSGALFVRGARMRERCSDCDLVYLEDRGDPWAFLMIIDRVAFIFPLVAALYFGLHRASLAGFVVFGAALGALFLATTPNRYGISVALVHWTRWRFGGGR